MANSKRPPNPKEATNGSVKKRDAAAVYGAFKQGVRGDSTQPKNYGSKKLAGEEYEAWKRGFNTKDVTGSSAMERNFIGAGGNGATPKPKPKGK